MGGTVKLVATGLTVVAALAVLVANGRTEPFDDGIIRAVRDPSLAGLLSPLGVITELGSTWAVTLIAAVVLVLLTLLGNPRWGIVSGATIGIASLINTAFKRWIERARPDALDPLITEHGFSFPSGHSMLGMTAWGVVAVVLARSDLPPLTRRLLVGACLLLVFLIGLSRIYLGVHYPSDVLAGWTAGAVVVLVYAAVTRRLARPQIAPDAVAESTPHEPLPSPGRAGAMNGAGEDREPSGGR
jgi:undecaprenyl-diphosphatase